MNMGYVLYNTKAGSRTNADDLKMLEVVMDEDLEFVDISSITDYKSFFSGLDTSDFLILAGGDGTLNRFVNDTEGISFENEILCFPCGTGNDFAHDLGYSKDANPFPIRKYLKDLPQVKVNGKSCRFINGVGYGIDGYCCEVGDRLKETPGAKVNYTAIAIKGLLFKYKPTNARVTVDGKAVSYQKVWLAPTMNGRFYGGGMMPTPEQKRNSQTLSTMVFHGSGKLKTLTIFPSLFKGEHVKHKKHVDIFVGKEITVEFDRPTPLQIDGETILNVTSYTAYASGTTKTA